MADGDLLSFVNAALGGVAIGLSAGLLYLSQGRIAGVSGLLGNVLRWDIGSSGFRLLFLLGVLLSPLLWRCLVGDPLAGIPVGGIWPAEWVSLLVGGLLVGIGTRMANGCTSGHGVCGLARFSVRSLLAVLSFMVAGGLTVYVVRHVVGS
jgi:hypothetical protein